MSTCGYHLVILGYKTHGPKNNLLDIAKHDAYDKFKKLLLSWLLSFMRPGYCENEDEYKISVKFFLSIG